MRLKDVRTHPPSVSPGLIPFSPPICAHLSTVPKPIPAPDFELLFPPVSETEAFRYFENCGEHPFRHDATALELVNAWWLAEASLLAYAHAEFEVEKFRAAGLDVANLRPFQHEGTQCYVAF